MALEGDVGTFPPCDLFAWLADRRATGVVTLTRGMTIRRFHLRGGRVRLVSSSEQEMLLGQLLLERNLLDAAALARALEGRRRSRAHLGRVLLRGGLVAPEDLRGILAEKVRRLLADALTWTDGRFLFEPGPAPARGAIAVSIDLRFVLDQVLADRALIVRDSDVIESRPAEPDDEPN
jgi:hypothetical protein